MNHSFHRIAQGIYAKPAPLFLPGWGFDGRILRLLKPSPSWIYPKTILDPETLEKDILHLLALENIRAVRIVGWSLGAMLGLDFATRHRAKVESLTLISLRSHWPEPEVKDLQTEFSLNPQAFLKNFFRKCFLGDKPAYRVFSKTIEPLYLADLSNNTERLQRGLEYLSAFNFPSEAPDLPIKLIHGKQDIIAPVAEIAAIKGADVEIIENAGHAVFLHEDCSLQNEFKKNAIQLKFSRAADSYDNYAKVQTEVARRLAAKIILPKDISEISTILEIGCGTGNFTSLLVDKFPAARIVALDFSQEMIANARHKLKKSNIEFICAEGEQFLEETADRSFDLVVSNGSLQWFYDIDKALHNIARILTPGGSMSCSIFGPQSLNELGKGLHAIQTLPGSLAAQTFPQPERLQHALHNNFQEGKVEEELIEKEYSSAYDLLLHIKKTGTSGWQQNMQQPLTPSRLIKLDEWFEKTYGACKVTYQILYLQGNK